MPTSLRFGPSAHVPGMCEGCGYVVSYSRCASIKSIETETSQKSPLSPPIHAQISADLSTAQKSRIEAAGFYGELYLS